MGHVRGLIVHGCTGSGKSALLTWPAPQKLYLGERAMLRPGRFELYIHTTVPDEHPSIATQFLKIVSLRHYLYPWKLINPISDDFDQKILSTWRVQSLNPSPEIRANWGWCMERDIISQKNVEIPFLPINFGHGVMYRSRIVHRLPGFVSNDTWTDNLSVE